MEKILLFLQSEMTRPQPWGWFHWMWIFITIGSIVCLTVTKHSEKKLRIILLVYGIIAAALELTKQVIWTVNYDALTDMFIHDYQWYAAPFQLCTTPLYVSIVCGLLKDCKLRKSLLSYMSFVTILGGFMTLLIPESCFVETIQVNIHTMWLHCGGFVVSVYLLASGAVELNWQNLLKAITIFVEFVFVALAINVIVYHSGVLNGETFNMFYISPYFISSLPVFNTIQQNTPYVVFLLIYVLALSLGATIVYLLAQGVSHVVHLFQNKIKNIHLHHH